MPSVQTAAPVAPMTIAQEWSTMSGPAVIATRPLIAPLSDARRSTCPNTGRERTSAVITPAAAARLVLTRTLPIATASDAPLNASCEPPLKPRKPSQMMNTPSVTAGTLAGGVDLTVPSLRNLPLRAPITSTPASAAHPPVEWTTVDPAKSRESPWRRANRRPTSRRRRSDR